MTTIVCLLAVVGVLAGGQAPAQPQAIPVPIPPSTLYAVGDVMYRETSRGAQLVGQLLESLVAADPARSRVIVAGDVCNDDGRAECYERLEETAWGRLRPLLYPVPGNHDYEDAKRNGGVPYYFNYMLNAGERERGWYAFDWGGWRVLALNSEVMARNPQTGLSPIGLEQMAWMESELRLYSKERCVMMYYHRPMFSSGRFASPAWVGPLFRRGFKYGVDFYMSAHEHMFAALPPLSPTLDPRTNVAIVDRQYGIPGVISGTGGAVLFPAPSADPQIKTADRRMKWGNDGEQVVANTWGVVRIDLSPGAYRWEFIPAVPVPGVTFPSGTGTCHNNPPGYVEPLFQ